MTSTDSDDALVPTTVWRPGTSNPRPSTATMSAGSGGHGRARAGTGGHGGGGVVGRFGQTGEPPLPPPRPLVDSVGDIAGLRPRRRARDGGEVPGADVYLIDALPRADDEPMPGQRASWPTVAAWLRGCVRARAPRPPRAAERPGRVRR
ncbi:hypothetical protein [Nonomuraea sp. GTA35]|uniref:hypothetical protein n=1 Tax=Nonomuraea sp. GTA35 TaxID=1676746 RepID=UPI0035BEB69D